MGTLRFFEEVVSFKIRRTFGFADYTHDRTFRRQGIFRIPQCCGSRSVRHDASAARLRPIPDRLQGPFGRPCKRAHLQSLQLPRNFPTGYPLRRTDRRQLETNRRTRERHHTNDLMGKCRPQSTGCRHRTVPFVHRRNKVGKQSGGFVK